MCSYPASLTLPPYYPVTLSHQVHALVVQDILSVMPMAGPPGLAPRFPGATVLSCPPPRNLTPLDEQILLCGGVICCVEARWSAYNHTQGSAPHVFKCDACHTFFVRARVQTAPFTHLGGPDLFVAIPDGTWVHANALVLLQPTVLVTTRAVCYALGPRGQLNRCAHVRTLVSGTKGILSAFGEMPNCRNKNFRESWQSMSARSIPDPSFNMPSFLLWLANSRPEGEPLISGFVEDQEQRQMWLRNDTTAHADLWGKPAP